MTATPTATIAPPGRRPRAAAGTGWLHLCNGLDPRRDGGMVPSILGMTGALARRVGRVRIATPTASRREVLHLPVGVELSGPIDDVAGAVRAAEVVHLHGLWQVQTRIGAAAARRLGVPHLIAAHGMAEPWALRHKALKKRVYTALVEGRNLQRASCLHALSRPEVGHLRALAPKADVCYVPNGVDLGPLEDLPGREQLERDHPELIGKFVLLFYGRLHVKKGLDLLAAAMDALAEDRPDLHVVLAGNDDGALGPFLDMMEEIGLDDRVTVLGYCSGESARLAWGAADAFVLPSYSEGFSMAILEALACRLPVLATTACHFPDLDDRGAGVVVEPTPRGVTDGLRSLVERAPAERRAMGLRGRALVEERYTWDRQAARLEAVYRWLLGGGPVPDAVDEGREIASLPR